MTFASTCVWLNQGAASTEHVKAGVRAYRFAKAASRATGPPYNRNPFVEDPHPSSPRPKTRRNCTHNRYNTLPVGRQRAQARLARCKINVFTAVSTSEVARDSPDS